MKRILPPALVLLASPAAAHGNHGAALGWTLDPLLTIPLGLALVIYLVGWYMHDRLTQSVGLILLAHSSMDRAMGYGLKYFSGFSDTHLGKIGRAAKAGTTAKPGGGGL